MGFFDAIGSAFSAVTDVVSSAVNVVADVATLDFGGAAKSLGGLIGGIGDTFEAVTGMLGPIGDVLNDALGALASGGGLGGILNSALDSLGLPDWIGDIAGGVLDFCTGNYVGALANGLDALEDVAKACGGDEIAGFLKAGSQVTGMFSGSMNIDPGQIGGLLGSASDTLATINTTLGGVEKLMGGDVAGAANALLDGLGGNFGGLDTLLGPAGKDVLETLSGLLPGMKESIGVLNGMMDNLGIDPRDFALEGSRKLPELLGFPGNLPGILHQLPDFADAMQQHNLAEPMGFFTSVCNAGADFLQQASLAHTTGFDAGFNSMAGGFVGSIIDAFAQQVGISAGDLNRLQEQGKGIAQLFNMGMESPNALDILVDLLAQAPALPQGLQTVLQQVGALRA